MTDKATPGVLQVGDDPFAAAMLLATSGLAMLEGLSPELRYRRVGEGYECDRVCQGDIIAIGYGATVRFALPASDLFDFVQMILPALPGCYRLQTVTLLDCVVPDIARRLVHVVDRQEPVAGGALRVASDMARPSIELDMRGLIETSTADAGTQLHLDVQVVREDPVAGVTAALSAGLQALTADFAALSRVQGAHAFSHIQQLRLQTEALQQQSAKQIAQGHALASLSGSLESQAVALDAMREQVQAVAAQVEARAQGQSDALSAAHHQVVNLLMQQADVLADQLGQQAGAISTLHASMGALQDQVSDLKHSVENVFWRRWVRRLRGGFR